MSLAGSQLGCHSLRSCYLSHLRGVWSGGLLVFEVAEYVWKLHFTGGKTETKNGKESRRAEPQPNSDFLCLCGGGLWLLIHSRVQVLSCKPEIKPRSGLLPALPGHPRMKLRMLGQQCAQEQGRAWTLPPPQLSLWPMNFQTDRACESRGPSRRALLPPAAAQRALCG